MAVTKSDIVDVEASVNEEAERDYVVTYQISTDATDGPLTAGNGAPSRFTVFSFGGDTDSGALLKRKKVKYLRARDSYSEWTVRCEYDSRADTVDNSQEFDDPLLKPTKWSGSFVQFTRDFLRDKDDDTIKNAAGDPFVEPPITGDDSRMSIVAVKNFSGLSLTVWASFRDAVNDNTWWGLAARKIKVQSITWDQLFHDGTPFYAVRFEFHINDATWDDEILEAGFYERVDGKRQRIFDKLGRDINRAWPLTAGGVALTEAQIDNGEEVYATVQKYTEKNFALLGLPAAVGTG